MSTEKTAQMVIATDTAVSPVSVEVRCSGAWTVRGVGQLEPGMESMQWPAEGELVFNAAAISALDTAGAWLLHRTLRALEQRGKTVRIVGLQPEFSALLKLVAARAKATEYVAPASPGGLAKLGRLAWSRLRDFINMLAFVGETAIALMRLLAHPRRIRWRPILHNLQTAGFEALPITGLLSFLMGVVIAYQGADQLQRFGANIYVADMVGFTMLRELSPMLTAIIVAGRSGSAYAAQIGTMKVTEEIDALRTIGIAPNELLVLPKMLALMIALPLLTVYADVTGILGGMIMASSKLDVSYDVFIDRIGDAINLSSFLTGVVKAPVFAVIIAMVGCFQGFQVSGSADSVGRQTTLSVVHSIFLVIVTDAVFSLVFNWLKI